MWGISGTDSDLSSARKCHIVGVGLRASVLARGSKSSHLKVLEILVRMPLTMLLLSFEFLARKGTQ